ncbi:MAG TPA: polysaccharide deacetylase family protein, partial [Myxococcota bacterium]|nr:polysaccharide deacetylase family protein [Myxococcota bacterium]
MRRATTSTRRRARRGFARAALVALALAAGAADPARAGETWIDADPGPGRLALVWKEGALAAPSEGGRPFTRITTDGRGAPAFAARAGGYEPALDARGRVVKLLLRVHGIERLAGLELRLGSDGLATHWFGFGVPLYADTEYNLLQDGEWTALTLSFGGALAQGAPERAAIDSMGLVVRDDGGGSVQVDLGGWALVDEPAEGVLSFTFDDGYSEHLAAARAMAARGWRGTAYVIPTLVGRAQFLGRAQLAELGRLGWDVAAHDETPLTRLPPERIDPTLRAVQRFLAGEGFAGAARHFAYPLGKQEPRRVRPAVRQLFATARIAGGGPETLPPADPHLLRAVNVVDALRPEAVGAAARRARAHKEWLILMFHHLVETPGQSTDYALADFAKLLDEVAASGIR